jgi:hypothetical protein
MMDTMRQVCRNVKRWSFGSIALHWTAAGMLESSEGKATNALR